MAIVNVYVNSDLKDFYSASIVREGERAVDTCRIKFPLKVSLTENHKVEYVQDMIDLTNVSAIYTFEKHVKDESGKGMNGTATAITYVDGKAGYSAKFNGSTSFISVPDHASLNFSGQFDLSLWVKTNVTTKRTILAKRSSTSNGIAIFVDENVNLGKITVEIAGSSITSTTQVNTNSWFHVRVYRDSSNVVKLYINNTQEGSTPTISTDLTVATALLFGKDFDSTKFYDGELDICRILKGGNISDREATNIVNHRNPPSVMKFGGKLRFFDKKIFEIEAEAKSFGKELGEQEIRGVEFELSSPESIVQSLITNHTSLTYVDPGVTSGITITKFIADGKLLDIITDLANSISWTFKTDALQNFIFEPIEFKTISLTLTHGNNSIINIVGKDDSELVNDLTVLGENKRYDTTQTFSGDGSTTQFNLSKGPTSIKVSVGGTEKVPDDDYTVDAEDKVLVFETAPASGVNNISVSYEYEDPLYIRGTKEASITTYGRRAKRLIMPWIKNMADGIRFVQAYLIAYKDMKQRYEVELPFLAHGIRENDVFTLVNSIYSINTQAVVKSISWFYPEGKTILNMGEFSFTEFEAHKQIVDKIHDLESAITVIKDINEFVPAEETLSLTDVVIDPVSYNQSKYADVATYGATYVYTRTELFKAKYSVDNYGDDSRVYGAN